MAEGQSPEIPITRTEVPKVPPKSLLKRTGDFMKDAVMATNPGGAALLVTRESLSISGNLNQVEKAENITPTEASKGFLERWKSNIRTYGPVLLPAVAAIIAGPITGSTLPEDIVSGNYKKIAVKGLIVGVSAIPLVRKTFSKNNNQ